MNKRYTFDPDCSQEEQCECSMEECPAGEYVSTDDYEKLQAQLAKTESLYNKLQVLACKNDNRALAAEKQLEAVRGLVGQGVSDDDAVVVKWIRAALKGEKNGHE